MKQRLTFLLTLSFVLMQLWLHQPTAHTGDVTPTIPSYLPIIIGGAGATAVATLKPTATETAVPQPAGCSICSSDFYNCSDFSTQLEAQACHDYCFVQVGFDVHRLDRDKDGIACENKP